jgi:hypothetical protein
MLAAQRFLDAIAAREECHHADLLAMFCLNKYLSVHATISCAASLWQTLEVTGNTWCAIAPSFQNEACSSRYLGNSSRSRQTSLPPDTATRPLKHLISPYIQMQLTNGYFPRLVAFLNHLAKRGYAEIVQAA